MKVAISIMFEIESINKIDSAGMIEAKEENKKYSRSSFIEKLTMQSLEAKEKAKEGGKKKKS